LAPLLDEDEDAALLLIFYYGGSGGVFAALLLLPNLTRGFGSRPGKKEKRGSRSRASLRAGRGGRCCCDSQSLSAAAAHLRRCVALAGCWHAAPPHCSLHTPIPLARARGDNSNHQEASWVLPRLTRHLVRDHCVTLRPEKMTCPAEPFRTWFVVRCQ
jgi:hypothetical protein